jgi:NAD(P)-dependent dehydrogenase (short-subunit alcohol dehydrogenase family)
MPATFSVQRALVTGAARGIGEAVARRLADEGLDVALVDLDPVVTETAASIAEKSGRTAVGFTCDVSDRDQVRRTVAEAAEALGGLDTVVANAGITRDGFLHKLSDDHWDAVVGVHLTGTFATIQAAAPFLRSEGPGRVVCISSLSGRSGNLGQANYSAAKAGVIGLTKTSAQELARFATTVNAVAPGFVDTAMTQAMPSEMRAKLLQTIPLGRSAQPQEIAGVVAFLCSDDAAFMTGAVLDVNGGVYM